MGIEITQPFGGVRRLEVSLSGKKISKNGQKAVWLKFMHPHPKVAEHGSEFEGLPG